MNVSRELLEMHLETRSLRCRIFFIAIIIYILTMIIYSYSQMWVQTRGLGFRVSGLGATKRSVCICRPVVYEECLGFRV